MRPNRSAATKKNRPLGARQGGKPNRVSTGGQVRVLRTPTTPEGGVRIQKENKTTAQQCRVCQKTKTVQFFAAVPLCAACDAAIAREALTRVPAIRTALRVQVTATDRVLLVELCERALEQAEALHRFERLGIPTTSPAPSCLLRDLHARRAALQQPAADPSAGQREYAEAGRGSER
jgi:ribosomal protein L37AE/L43A